MTSVERISNEIERLETQHEEALIQLKNAERELEELNEYRIELAPAAFTGDEVADKNLMVLEGEASKLSRGARLARNAAKEFERLIEEARKRRAQERQHLARERYEAIHSEQVACAQDFGGYSPATKPPHTLIQEWLVSRLKEYLGLSSIDHYYDNPLFEVDDLAAKREAEGR